MYCNYRVLSSRSKSDPFAAEGPDRSSSPVWSGLYQGISVSVKVGRQEMGFCSHPRRAGQHVPCGRNMLEEALMPHL